MREIKFRAWDKVYQQMSHEFVLFGEFTLLGAVHDWQWEITGKGPEEVKDYSSLLRLNDLDVMQFTGLKDKNGKEIYEGDIVIPSFEAYYEVIWEGACWKIRDCKGNQKPATLRGKRIRVIGNIYENSELLTK